MKRQHAYLLLLAPLLTLAAIFLPQTTSADEPASLDCVTFEYVVEEHPEGGNGRWAETQDHWVYIETQVEQRAECDVGDADIIHNTRWDYDPQDSDDDELFFLPSEELELQTSVIIVEEGNFTEGFWLDFTGTFTGEGGADITLEEPDDDALAVLEGNPPGETPDPTRYGQEPDDDEDTGPDCEAGGVVELVMCQVLNSILNGMEGAQQYLAQALFETDALSATDTDGNIYQVWAAIRDIANALLVLAFMAIIFSLALSVNVDAYTIKRLVPKLLIAAVSIQASFLISALMVDLTNALGRGLAGLTDIALEGFDLTEAFGNGAGSVTAVGVGTVLVGGALVAMVNAAFQSGPGLLYVVFMFVGFLALVVLGALLIVALREILIMLFITLSPLAFLSNLLPATERWLSFWWSNFLRVLMMYPFIVLMIQFGNIASYIAIDREGFLGPFLAVLMQTVAFLSVYFAFQIGGSVVQLATRGTQSFMKRQKRSAEDNKQSGNPLRKAWGSIQEGRQRGKTGEAGKGSQFLQSPIRTTATGAAKQAGKLSGRDDRLGTFGAWANTKAQGAEGANASARVTEMENMRKEMEALGINEKTWIKIAPYLSDKTKFKQQLNNLLNSSDADEQQMGQEATRIKDEHIGKKSSVGAAMQLATAQGFGDKNETLSMVSQAQRELGDDSPVFQQAKLQSFINSNKNGRQDIAQRLHPSPDHTPEKQLQAMGVKDFLEAKDPAIEDPEMKEAIGRLGTSDRQMLRTLKAATDNRAGMSAKKRDAIINALNDHAQNQGYSGDFYQDVMNDPSI